MASGVWSLGSDLAGQQVCEGIDRAFGVGTDIAVAVDGPGKDARGANVIIHVVIPYSMPMHQSGTLTTEP